MCELGAILEKLYCTCFSSYSIAVRNEVPRMTCNDDEADRSEETPATMLERVGNRLSRRTFMGNTAKAGGGLALMSAGSGVAAAHGGDDDDDGDGDEMPDDVLGI